MKQHSKSKESRTELQRRRTVARYTVIAFGLLFIGLAAGSTEPGGTQGIGTIAWLTLTLGAIIVLMYSALVNYRRSDERQQLLQLKATAPAFMFVASGLFIAQLLDTVELVKLSISVQVIFLVGVLLWHGILSILERRNEP